MCIRDRHCQVAGGCVHDFGEKQPVGHGQGCGLVEEEEDAEGGPREGHVHDLDAKPLALVTAVEKG
eukprot:14190083-Heterocapsa_arctica.AAC.1